MDGANALQKRPMISRPLGTVSVFLRIRGRFQKSIEKTIVPVAFVENRQRPAEWGQWPLDPADRGPYSGSAGGREPRAPPHAACRWRR